MSELVSCKILDDSSTPIERARLAGDGWYIEFTKVDEFTIEISSGGTKAGTNKLLVMPRYANSVYVTLPVDQEYREFEAAKDIHRLWRADEELRRSKGLTK